jgi:(2Fe-2S) ferredoxin
MKIEKAPHLVYLQVCEHERNDGKKFCGPEGANLRELLKSKIKSLDLSHKIRVMRTGCFDLCQQGPNVVMMPQNKWYQRVSEDDLPKIIEDAVQALGNT